MSSLQDSVYVIDPLHDPRWPEFVTRHPSASVFHSHGWLRALRETYGYEPVAYTTSAPTDLLTNALLFCIVRSWLTGNRLVSLPFSDHCEPLVDHPGPFETLSAHVERARSEAGWKYVELRSADSQVDFAGRFAPATVYCLHRLDLRSDLDSLYRGFHKDCIQRKIVRAEREGLTYEAGRSDALLQQLYGLLRLTRSRHRLPPQPIEWFRNLVACMGDDACIRIASKAGTPLAGILTLRHRNSMVYKYGGSNARFNNLGGMAMLFWHAIQDAKRTGCEVFDFGRSDLDHPGLIAFKERWSAESSSLITWRAPGTGTVPGRGRISSRYMREMFARMPEHVTLLAGRMLYRHFG
ncbi:MAG: GNAT family N-acetyltransferase [Nitrospira sp.]|nr:GNAT family N-acetyltransferase [Nitrospira sp.]